jgi:MmyB-like transcription regulator ligand binding domain
VAGFESRERRFHHPTSGLLRFRYQQLVPAGDPDLRLVVLLPVPGDDSAERLARSIASGDG